ncbi:methyl-accepting chemotaxis protein [Vibrio sinaloensis]|uniref:methyl-accepting chemotaxis protein n=1 Tax=Photobacterium sp. (strain ATCC 43367) TaxID=379097 RepID=UPI0022AEF695|nr:methyl-accepting chemotaxis protein [Vibrio sinaloensis]MCZ4294189.1 methyl-accepting chemotaxis protein [Vibrio sinaloensis]
METMKKNTFSLSLIQTISAVFFTITLLVILLSVTSIKGLENIRQRFSELSQQALPLAMTNAELTQNILEQVKQLSYATGTQSIESLQTIEQKILIHEQQSTALSDSVVKISAEFDNAVTPDQTEQLTESLFSLVSQSNTVIATQRNILTLEKTIASELDGFRYGLGSIGPEMNRISSFLVGDNPESADAANRFIANVSSMESSFVQLMMTTELDQAQIAFKEMKNRLAGVNLAYDDFKQWHPDVVEFASLTAGYEMVLSGFESDAIVEQILAKLELVSQQRRQVEEVVIVADKTIALLNDISSTANTLIGNSQRVVSSTMQTTATVVLTSSVVLVAVIIMAWFILRAWTNRGLKNILTHLNRMTEHDLTGQALLVGPLEMKEIANKLNQVIRSTNESIALVTRNCETLYQTAEISHGAAEQSNQSLTEQNQSLASMIATINQLEASIREIATVTAESYNESTAATRFSAQGVNAIEENQTRLRSLANTLNANEESMVELDKRVKQIREMVDLISGIAENTNLLALNAAIEAARAGEQGRGFAVVADEVRKLASDTSNQTTNIRERMNQLVAAAERSRLAVEESRQEMNNALESSEVVKSTFNDIEAAVTHIQTRVEQVTIATEEQERATEHVSSSISLISEQGQQTKMQLESMVESSQQVAGIAGNQQAMLHKYSV